MKITRELLLQNLSLDINHTTDAGNNAFILAVESERLTIVKHLLAQPLLEINWINYDDMTALMLAAKRGQTAIVQAILKRIDFSAINHADETIWQTVLIRAVISGQTDVVRCLLAAPTINVKHIDRSGQSARDWAVHQGHQEIIKLLDKYFARSAIPCLSTIPTLNFFGSAHSTSPSPSQANATNRPKP